MLAALGLRVVGVILMRKLGGDEPGPVAAKVVYAWSMLCLARCSDLRRSLAARIPLGFALRMEVMRLR